MAAVGVWARRLAQVEQVEQVEPGKMRWDGQCRRWGLQARRSVCQS
ncbi:MAG: hypothetical protein JO006_20190 [Paucibacter sp.]|nr:hypothetical protein [Roseateles sp.]